MPATGNYILGVVGPSGGPSRCPGQFYSDLPDRCTTKGASCCHTPIASFPVNQTPSPVTTPWWNGNSILSKGKSNSFYFLKHPVGSQPSGCQDFTDASDYGNLISFTTPDGDNKQFPGNPVSFDFYVNYGCTIYLDFLFTVPLIPYAMFCSNWLSLSIEGLNPPNLGVLSGDWYKNSPYGYPDPFFCTPYDCENNTSLAAGTIAEPYLGGGGDCTRGNTATYHADLNPYPYVGEMTSFLCDPNSYCCETVSECCAGKDEPPSCTNSGESGCSINFPLACNCGQSNCSPGFELCSARYNNIPYATVAASYRYTCDNLNGVLIQIVLEQALDNIGDVYTSYFDENGNYDIYGPYYTGINSSKGSWGYMNVECIGCGGCPSQSHCD